MWVPQLSIFDATVSEANQQLQHNTTVLKEQLARAHNKMKMAADKKRRDQHYQVGEQILMKLQPYAQSSLVNRPFPMLAFKYFDPYTVLERIGPTAYRLDLPADSLIHLVFHVSQLKPFTPNYTPVFSVLPQLPDLDRDYVYT